MPSQFWRLRPKALSKLQELLEACSARKTPLGCRECPHLTECLQLWDWLVGKQDDKGETNE